MRTENRSMAEGSADIAAGGIHQGRSKSPGYVSASMDGRFFWCFVVTIVDFGCLLFKLKHCLKLFHCLSICLISPSCFLLRPIESFLYPIERDGLAALAAALRCVCKLIVRFSRERPKTLASWHNSHGPGPSGFPHVGERRECDQASLVNAKQYESDAVVVTVVSAPGGRRIAAKLGTVPNEQG